MTSDGDICYFADDNTIYQCCSNLNDVKLNIERQCKLVTSWFESNCMKMNAEMCHAIITGKRKTPRKLHNKDWRYLSVSRKPGDLIRSYT